MEIEGLSQLIKRFEVNEKELPKVIEKATMNIGNKLLARTVLKTPVGQYGNGQVGGTLRRGWQVKKINGYTVKVYNNVEYAPHVEFGHRTRQGAGNSKGYKPKKNGKTYVEGRYMLTKSLEELKDDLVEEFEGIVENLWEK